MVETSEDEPKEQEHAGAEMQVWDKLEEPNSMENNIGLIQSMEEAWEDELEEQECGGVEVRG